jgi:sulfoxide reductase heme-binding subunit YedZ
LGLYAFLYTALHFLTFAWWDYGLQIDLLGPVLFGRGFVVYGLAALVLLVPLAITSTKGWRRRLGRWWQRLHWLFYPAAILAVVHYLRIGKDRTIPVRYAAIVGVLLLIRFPWVRRALERARLGIRAWAGRRAAREGTTTPRT